MRYKNGDREFNADFKVVDANDYIKVTDIKTKVIFKLPRRTIVDCTS